MARKKSYNDILTQRNRILSEVARRRGFYNLSRSEFMRYRRVQDIASRYMKNIATSKQWKNAFAKGKADYERYNSTMSHLNGFNAESSAAGYGKADSTKVSRRTYMGLSNG